MYARNERNDELTAVLISPNQAMAEAFLATVPTVRGFQLLSELSSYPSPQTLEIRLRQLQPQVVLIDLSTNIEQASELIRMLSIAKPPVPVIGIHTHNDSEVILHAVRQGASEFLYAPFDPGIQMEAVARLKRMRQPEQESVRELGKIIVFSSAKPGSGSSTLSTQTAFALKRATGKRILLADLDLLSGTISLYLKLTHRSSLAELLRSPVDPANWAEHTVTCGGVDILTAPDLPYTGAVDPSKLQEIVQSARYIYDWIILDVPTVFHRMSLLAISEADKAYLVSTTELPSLHLTRKAIALLGQMGFNRDRFQVIVNRVNKRDDIGGTDMAKLFDCPVHATLPNDYFSLHRVITLGRPLTNDCDLGKAIELLAAKISGNAPADKKKAGTTTATRAAIES